MAIEFTMHNQQSLSMMKSPVKATLNSTPLQEEAQSQIVVRSNTYKDFVLLQTVQPYCSILINTCLQSILVLQLPEIIDAMLSNTLSHAFLIDQCASVGRVIALQVPHKSWITAAGWCIPEPEPIGVTLLHWDTKTFRQLST